MTGTLARGQLQLVPSSMQQNAVSRVKNHMDRLGGVRHQWGVSNNAVGNVEGGRGIVGDGGIPSP
jgi:hypothetical protein